MAPNKNNDTRDLLLEAILSGMNVPQAAHDLGLDDSSAYYYVSQLIQEGRLKKLGRGRYAVGDGKKQEAPARPTDNGHLAYSTAQRVEIPAYMRTRKPVTIYVERSPEEIEGVILLELKIGGQWFPIPVNGDLRVCVGSDIPRWSAYQTTYHGVQAFRVTHANGRQPEYPHDPNIPVTVDAK